MHVIEHPAAGQGFFVRHHHVAGCEQFIAVEGPHMQVMDGRYAFHVFELFDDPLGVNTYWDLFEQDPE